MTKSQMLLQWTKELVASSPIYAAKGVHIRNWHTAWKDGLAFCALIHAANPSLINWDSLKAGDAHTNLSLAFSVAGMLSLLGRCHTFDGRADGYCRGEGCGAFRIEGDGSDEYTAAAFLGSAVQQDGPSASLTAPNGSSQRRLLDTVRNNSDAGGDPALEAHGTGTALGDPIEVG